MKNNLLLCAVLFCATSIFGQVTRLGILGVGAGPNGLTLHLIDGNYAPSPKYDVGVFFNFGIGADDNEASAGTTLGVQGKYYLMTGTFKPFVGAQIGPRFGASVKVDPNLPDPIADAGTKFAAIPQVGFRVGPFNLWGSYDGGIMGNAGFVFGFGNFNKN